MLKVCDIRQFIDRIKKLDRIVCFGAGKRFETLIDFFADTEILNKISCVVDNDKNKQHTQIAIGGNIVDIISLEELKERNYINFVIIITCVDYSEIIKQLDADRTLHDMEYYCLYHMQLLELEEAETREAFSRKIPSNIRLSKESLIPKVIHYCWFGGNPIPDKYKIWMESWKKFCPDYDIVEWNENNYDITKNDYMREAYENKKWGFVPDYARLDIIYNHGGIYLDTDVELVKNIDDLLYQKGFAGFESKRYVNLGVGFGAVKGLPIIKNMMDMYENMKFVNEDGSLNLVASPHYQTQALEEQGLLADGEYQRVGDMTIYPEKVLSGKSWTTRRVILHSYTRSVHHFDASWVGDEEKKIPVQIERDMRLYQPGKLSEKI